jgi:hypothetical protein
LTAITESDYSRHIIVGQESPTPAIQSGRSTVYGKTNQMPPIH